MLTSDPHSVMGCLDALDNAAGLLDLLGNIGITGVHAPLSPAAANAHCYLTKMLRDTVRHCSDTLHSVQAMRIQKSERETATKHVFLKSLLGPEEIDRDHVYQMMELHLDMDRSMFDEFLGMTETNKTP